MRGSGDRLRGPPSPGLQHGQANLARQETPVTFMDPARPDGNLSRISTLWTLVRQAHRSEGETATLAQRQILERYQGAIHRYLQGAVGKADVANELFQEFACRFLSGKLAGADAERGRFRDYVKGVLYHLITDYFRQLRKQARPLPEHHPDLEVDPPTLAEVDQALLASWREELLARTWLALEGFAQRTGQPWYQVLRYRADHPDAHSPDMAAALSAALGRSLTAVAVRQMLHRSREKFADLLLDEVVHSLDDPTEEQLADELESLRLIDYCQPALRRRSPSV
jgi:DNA-directed RNA polymerase specialized sigma24 family protein